MTRSDLYIVILIILLAAGIYLMYIIKTPPVRMLIVRQSGKVVLNMKLPDKKIFNINVGQKSWVLEVNDSKVRVIKSNCLQKTCIKQGWIDKDNITLICAPQKFHAELKGENNNSSIDAVTR